MSELKPCPFCGRPAEKLQAQYSEGIKSYTVDAIECQSKGCEACICRKPWETYEDLVERWNNRVDNELMEIVAWFVEVVNTDSWACRVYSNLDPIPKEHARIYREATKVFWGIFGGEDDTSGT